MSNQDKKRKKKSFAKLIIFLCFFIYAGYIFISQQVTIFDKKTHISDLDRQIAQAKDESKELDSQKKTVNSPEYIEKIARSELGYVAPNEIIFIDATSQN